MAHFAKLDENSIVQEVLVITQDVIDSGAFGDPKYWYQTSYNTYGGVYYIPNSNPREPDPDQSKAFRKNYAGVGFTYDPVRDAFIPPRPVGNEWVLDEFSCLWVSNEAPAPQ